MSKIHKYPFKAEDKPPRGPFRLSERLLIYVPVSTDPSFGHYRQSREVKVWNVYSRSINPAPPSARWPYYNAGCLIIRGPQTTLIPLTNSSRHCFQFPVPCKTHCPSLPLLVLLFLFLLFYTIRQDAERWFDDERVLRSFSSGPDAFHTPR